MEAAQPSVELMLTDRAPLTDVRWSTVQLTPPHRPTRSRSQAATACA